MPNISGAEREDAARIDRFLGRLSLTFGRLDGFTDRHLTLHRAAHVIPTKRSSSLSCDVILSDGKVFDTFNRQDDCPESAGGLDVTLYPERWLGTN